MSEALQFDQGLRDHSGRPASWPELALLGRPVGHSLSPRLHAAALRADAREGEYRCVDVGPEQLQDALAEAASRGVRGLNLTLPHKRAVLDLAGRLSSEAEEVGAANTLVVAGGANVSSRATGVGASRWIAHNTDSRGLAMALERMLGRRLKTTVRRVLVLGSGGAARAACHCMRSLGAKEIRVASRSAERARWVAEAGARWEPIEGVAVEGVQLLLQCTSLGLREEDPSPIALEGAGSDLVVFDMVYGDHRSALLREASRRQLSCENGVSMLVAQAALAYSMWFGGLPPVDVMAAAVGLDW